MPGEIATLGGTIDAGLHPININRGWLEFRIADAVPDKDTPIVVYCGINQRSPLAARTLMDMGYTRVYNYTDGFFAWRDAGLPVNYADEATGTMLFRTPEEVSPGIWTSIGATAPATYENSGHNNNLSFIITDDGVVVINAGDNYLLAQALHREIKQRTEQPVKYVILENGQGHAMLGMNYWQEQGATVIAHEDAVQEIKHYGEDILARMQRRNRDKAMGTALSLPDESIGAERIIELGGVRIEVLQLGPAHSPGDILVWLPQKKIVISGDLAFHQRLLPVFEDTDTAAWIETWPAFAALEAEIVIPGHGDPTVMEEVERYTIGYLKHLREEIGQLLEDGGTLIDAYSVDQSAYRHLDTFTELAVRNADRVYRAMEFE
ncbi:MAG: MBL fold metallo-hydrolase [Granulosicoccus sp.]|nr:MBL fold metallo-hydrolase [Granulosicoccus sp.]